MTDRFKEIKGNCNYSLDGEHRTSGIDHCTYHDDDCRESCCPHMAKPLSPAIVFGINNEMPLAQCPTCGSEVEPDRIEKPVSFVPLKLLGIGIIIGILLRQGLIMVLL
jgi:hypothetical protein